MNAYGSTGLFGMLVATSLVSGAAAMEINQQRAPSTGEAPAFTLPAFLDGARLPDLQDAWRAHFSDPSDAAVLQPASEGVSLQPDVTQETATRGEQTSREAAAVRTRAEELSSRFGAGAESTADSPTAGGADAPTETASVNADAHAAEPGQPVAEQVLAPAEDSVAAEVVAATDDAPVIEDMGTKPAKGGRRNAAPAPDRQPVLTTARSAPAPALIKVDPAAPKPEANPLMPSELRAFGWNAQP